MYIYIYTHIRIYIYIYVYTYIYIYIYIYISSCNTAQETRKRVGRNVTDMLKLIDLDGGGTLDEYELEEAPPQKPPEHIFQRNLEYGWGHFLGVIRLALLAHHSLGHVVFRGLAPEGPPEANSILKPPASGNCSRFLLILQRGIRPLRCLVASACLSSVRGANQFALRGGPRRPRVHPVSITRFPSFRTQTLENLSDL